MFSYVLHENQVIRQSDIRDIIHSGGTVDVKLTPESENQYDIKLLIYNRPAGTFLYQ